MPFGLRNAPATFQRLVDKVFKGMVGINLYVYIDGILIYSETWEDHLKDVDEVLKRLKENGLKASIDKTHWCNSQIEILVYLIGKGILKMDPSKVQDMVQIPTPPETIKNGRYSPPLRK
jgi:hypothetical protein